MNFTDSAAIIKHIIMNQIFKVASCFEILCLAASNIFFDQVMSDIGNMVLEFKTITKPLDKQDRHNPDILNMQGVLNSFITDFPKISSETYKSIFCIKKIEELNNAVDSIRDSENLMRHNTLLWFCNKLRREMIVTTPKIIKHWKEQSQALQLMRSLFD